MEICTLPTIKNSRQTLETSSTSYVGSMKNPEPLKVTTLDELKAATNLLPSVALLTSTSPGSHIYIYHLTCIADKCLGLQLMQMHSLVISHAFSQSILLVPFDVNIKLTTDAVGNGVCVISFSCRS